MLIGKIKEKLSSGQETIGSWMQLPSTDVAEIMACAGYDWVAVDLEHGNFSNQQLADIFRTLELHETAPFARIAEATQENIKHALEAGAQGLIYPMITSASQLEQAICWSTYPFSGQRGVGYCRANLFGKNFDNYINKLAPNIIKIAQIEHIDAVNNLDSILTVDGLNGIIVGPYDLSGSMDLTAKFDHPDFIRTMDTIKNKAKQYSVPMGAHVVQPNASDLNIKINDGYQFIAYGIDTVFLYNNCSNPVTIK